MVDYKAFTALIKPGNQALFREGCKIFKAAYDFHVRNGNQRWQ